jgi:hypothetical protein
VERKGLEICGSWAIIGAQTTMKSFLILAAAAGALSLNAAEPSKTLWQIGTPDHNDSEFALGPGGFNQYENDGLFVVGQSDPKRDWPYVQPGPVDAWAGSREHTFAVFFGLRQALQEGECQLRVDVLDAQQAVPPTLRIEVNDESFERALLPGGGDESIQGQPAKGVPQSVNISFPTRLLRGGENEIQITTLRGSWLLYDSVGLTTPAAAELTATEARTFLETVHPLPALREQEGKLFQPLEVTVLHVGADAEGSIAMEGQAAMPIHLQKGRQSFEVLTPAVAEAGSRDLTLQVGGQTVGTRATPLKPVRHLTIYVLPHSHNDIGYTQLQSAVAEKQVNNLVEGIAAARRTAEYPEGARFVWNMEVLWAADLYLHRLSEQQRADFFDAVKKGQVALNGMYLNELSGLCGPEELLRLFRYSTQLAQQCGVTIDSAMISDVPGATWGTVTAMAQAGIRYFSAAPNWFDRIGDILVNAEDRPFYWISRSGADKVLVWVPYKGYALSHVNQKLSPEFLAEYDEHLDQVQYPYEISYLRWSGHGDNAVPDPEICDFIKDWNAKYAYPRFIIASTSEAFHAFERRYAERLPVRRGDWTPYWEDGAGSSALETAINRANSERLNQAEKLWAMLNPTGYPAAAFDAAWRNVLLYSEHTWGAAQSVADPESQMTKEQWEIKRSYVLDADAQSRRLLDQAFGESSSVPAAPPAQVDVFNTAGWPRTELVVLPKETAFGGDRVIGDRGQPAPSQRLSGGELAFIAGGVAPFAAARYTVGAGTATPPGSAPATVQGRVLDNGLLRVMVDENSGGIVELRAKAAPGNLADISAGQSINEYLFLPGDNLTNLQGSGPVKITVREAGPLVASLVVESAAPGCRRLTREIRLTAGFDYVELIDTVDKLPSPLNPDPKDWSFAQKGGKESVNFAFPFNVPEGVLRLDIPLSMMEPEVDQIPGACKNWFPVNRWVDVANGDFGVAWVTLDAPLVEVGGITANLLGSQHDPAAWRKKVERSQKFYSWVMNNHWHTNYRASQDGSVVFRYVLWPHGKFQPEAATRLAIGFDQPLITRAAAGPAPSPTPRLRLSSDQVIVSAFKPSDDGKGWIVRLFGAAGNKAAVKLSWATPEPRQLWLSDTSEQPLQKVDGPVSVPAWGLVTVRAER